MTEKSAPDDNHRQTTLKELAEGTGSHSVQPTSQDQNMDKDSQVEQATPLSPERTAESEETSPKQQKANSLVCIFGCILFLFFLLLVSCLCLLFPWVVSRGQQISFSG